MQEIKICNSLASLRKSKGYTQLQLSELTNISQQYISGVERGIIVPTIQRAIKLADALEECYCNVFYKCVEDK